MRAYTLTDDALQPGIRLEDGMLAVGEEGRARKRVALRPPPGAVIERGVLLGVETPIDGEGFILVAVKVPAGFRGTAEVARFRQLETPEPCPNTGSRSFHKWPVSWAYDVPIAGDGVCTHCHGVFSFQGEHPPGHLVHHACEGIPLAWVLAHGSCRYCTLCAQGIAGRMGGHDEYLLIMPPWDHGPAVIAVWRTGRLYGDPAWVAVENTADGPRYVSARTAGRLAQALGWAPTPDPWGAIRGAEP